MRATRLSRRGNFGFLLGLLFITSCGGRSERARIFGLPEEANHFTVAEQAAAIKIARAFREGAETTSHYWKRVAIANFESAADMQSHSGQGGFGCVVET